MISLSPTWMLLALLQGTFAASYIFLNENGTDSMSCLEGNVACKTFDYLVQHSSSLNHSIICINGAIFHLDGLYTFVYVHNVTFVGLGQDITVLRCEHKSEKPATTGTGLHFYKSSHIRLLSFSLQNCGAKVKNSSARAAVAFQYCDHIEVSEMSFKRSQGYGLTLYNTVGNVNITASSFSHNKFPSSYFTQELLDGAGGIDIYAMSVSYFHYLVLNCHFANNIANTSKNLTGIAQTGGGIRLSLQNSTTSNTVELTNCIFEKNTGLHGGAIHLLFLGKSLRNNVTINQCLFSTNAAVEMGGGIDIAYVTGELCKNCYPSRNVVYIKSCHFTENIAEYGGGVSIYGLMSTNNLPHNPIEFTSSTWKANVASSGSAVDVSIDRYDRYQSGWPGGYFIAMIQFTNCSFWGNKPNSFGDQFSLQNQHGQVQTGVVFTAEVLLTFGQCINFENNSMTAIYATSAQIRFLSGAQANFFGNTGDKGGAIFMSGDATILYEGSVKFSFINNSATLGGAIYALPLQPHYLPYTDVCFLSQTSSHPFTLNEFIFKDNKAIAGVGTDIFVSSLKPCLGLCKKTENVYENVSKYFTPECTGNYTKVPKFATNPDNVSLVGVTSTPLQLFPGIKYFFNITQIDERGNNVSKLFPLAVKIPMNANFSVDPDYLIITDGMTLLHGPLGAKGILTFETSALNSKSASVQIVFSSQCPPGLIHLHGDCVCQNVYGNTYTYTGIVHCYKNMAYLTFGYWAGYVMTTTDHSEKAFVMGVCATSLCSFPSQNQTQSSHQLPQNPNELSYFICNNNRTGILCGHCEEGYSTYYHSPIFKCGADDGCKYGPLLYIVAELVPVTALFLTILLFNINLTSGALYSFVFFAQFLDSLFIDAFGTIPFKNREVKVIVNVLKAIYGIFNLNIPSVPFCIMKNASVMHILLFRYATIAYALLLVVLVILMLRLNFFHCYVRICFRCGRHDIRGSMIKGLTTFLVICYSQSAEISRKIMATSWLHDQNGSHFSTVPLFNGEMQFLENDHLWFAVPALACFATVTLPPIVILFCEPLLTTASNSQILNTTHFQRLLRITRLKVKPFLDSFQACFKNKYRFFAGMFFVYRIIVPVVSIISTSIIEAYIVSNLLLVIILLAHLLIQPFERKWHNQLDCVVFANLITINTLTIVNYYTSISTAPNSIVISVHVMSLVQILLMTLPLVFICTYIGVNMYLMTKHRNSLHAAISTYLASSKSNASEDSLSFFPARMLEREGLLSLEVSHS